MSVKFIPGTVAFFLVFLYIIFMEMSEIIGNEEILDLLLEQQENLVPFIGAGFSVSACPTWLDFLDHFIKNAKNDYLLPKGIENYKKLRKSNLVNLFELMADFLI